MTYCVSVGGPFSHECYIVRLDRPHSQGGQCLNYWRWDGYVPGWHACVGPLPYRVRQGHWVLVTKDVVDHVLWYSVEA